MVRRRPGRPGQLRPGLRRAPHQGEEAAAVRDGIYFAFKNAFETLKEEDGGVSGALESMTLASRRYAEFAFGRAADPEIGNLLGRARRLAEAPALLIMELSGLHDAGPPVTQRLRRLLGAHRELPDAARGLRTSDPRVLVHLRQARLRTGHGGAARILWRFGMATLPPTYRVRGRATWTRTSMGAISAGSFSTASRPWATRRGRQTPVR